MSEHSSGTTQAEVLGRVTEKATLGYAQHLMRFASINPPGNYGDVTKYVLEEFENLGLEIATTTCHEGRTNVVGKLAGFGHGTLSAWRRTRTSLGSETSHAGASIGSRPTSSTECCGDEDRPIPRGCSPG